MKKTPLLTFFTFLLYVLFLSDLCIAEPPYLYPEIVSGVLSTISSIKDKRLKCWEVTYVTTKHKINNGIDEVTLVLKDQNAYSREVHSIGIELYDYKNKLLPDIYGGTTLALTTFLNVDGYITFLLKTSMDKKSIITSCVKLKEPKYNKTNSYDNLKKEFLKKIDSVIDSKKNLNYCFKVQLILPGTEFDNIFIPLAISKDYKRITPSYSCFNRSIALKYLPPFEKEVFLFLANRNNIPRLNITGNYSWNRKCVNSNCTLKYNGIEVNFSLDNYKINYIESPWIENVNFLILKKLKKKGIVIPINDYRVPFANFIGTVHITQRFKEPYIKFFGDIKNVENFKGMIIYDIFPPSEIIRLKDPMYLLKMKFLGIIEFTNLFNELNITEIDKLIDLFVDFINKKN